MDRWQRHYSSEPAEKIKAGSLGGQVEGRHPIKNIMSLHPISRLSQFLQLQPSDSEVAGSWEK